MTFPTFPAEIPTPQLGTSITDDQRVLETVFGDGYRQVIGDGLNSHFSSGTLIWNGMTATQRTTLRDFFREVGKETPFWWTDPDGEAPQLWRFSDKINWTPLGGGLFAASVAIVEQFDLA